MYYYDTYDSIVNMFSGITLLIILIIEILILFATWKMYEKAGEAGWKCLIPIYNTYILYKIINGNGWTFLITLIPFIGWIYSIIVLNRLSKAFGHGIGFTLGLIFFSPIFYLILGLGTDEYYGPQV